MNLRHDPHTALLPTLAILCTVGTVCAQNFISTPATTPMITNHRQLASLALAVQPPEYPPVAKVNYLEGPVQIEITVGNSGRVERAHVLNGNPILAAAALKAVTLWLYRPLATQAGPVGFTARVRMKFSLHHAQTELTPQQAERDFERQVRPPHLVQPLNQAQWGELVHLRLLVNDQGRVIDVDVAHLDSSQLEWVLANMRDWTFHPAYWGTLPIAAYLTVDVPVASPPASPVAAITITH